MTIGFDNLTENATTNTTISDIQGGIGETIGEFITGGYGLTGILFLGLFAFVLYRQNVSLDVGISFMVPSMFVFGKYGLLPGGTGTMYGLVLAIGGLLAAGIFRYFR